MPITKSAKKALRQSQRRRVFNLRRMRLMREFIKQFRTLIKENKKDEAKKIWPQVQKAIDKAAKRGVIKKNNASRKKARLAKLLITK